MLNLDRRTFVTWSAASLGAWLTSRKAAAAGWGVDAAGTQPLLFGVDYYPDQTPGSLWEADAVAMAAAGVTNVRIAEFAWALMEPMEGRFDFEWLRRSVSILHAHGIAVILGTPSAAPPPWLSQKYPEILMVNEHGLTLSPGTRRFTCPTNATYRRLSGKIATEMARAFAHTAGVIGWQIDNELTLGDSPRCYCRYCRDGFARWLQAKYGSLDALNQAWGTVFWSNTYTDFSQVPTPLPSGAAVNPGHALDYDRYQSAANVSFLEEQVAIVRAACPSHFITHNNVGGLTDTIDLRDLYRKLDFASADNYPGFFAMYQNNGVAGADAASVAMAPMISFGHDFMRGVKDGEPFLVMEQQSGKAGQPTFSPQPEPGQLRLWSYQAVAHGAMGINYFRWDTATAGAEEYWHGLLRHDRSHSAGFAEIVSTIAELKALGAEALHARCVAGLALCFDSSADWALGIQPGQPQLKYSTEMVAWYGAASASEAGIDIVGLGSSLAGYKAVLAPAMYVLSAGQAEAIRQYVTAGGTFVAGCRLGVKDETSRMVTTPLPGLLRDVMGVELLDYQPIYSAKQGVRFSGMLAGAEAECRVWSDILEPKGAEVLATYTAGAYAGKPAITTHRFGKGRAVYVGAHLEGEALGRVVLQLLAASGVQAPAGRPRGVEITRRQSGGKQWLYVLNHTAAPQQVSLVGQYRVAAGGSAAGSTVTLEPYGAKVLLKG